MVSIDQIQKLIRRFLSDGDRDNFLRDFSALTYNIHQTGAADAVELRFQVEAALSERGKSRITHEEFISALFDLSQPRQYDIINVETFSPTARAIFTRDDFFLRYIEKKREEEQCRQHV